MAAAVDVGGVDDRVGGVDDLLDLRRRARGQRQLSVGGDRRRLRGGRGRGGGDAGLVQLPGLATGEHARHRQAGRALEAAQARRRAGSELAIDPRRVAGRGQGLLQRSHVATVHALAQHPVTGPAPVGGPDRGALHRADDPPREGGGDDPGRAQPVGALQGDDRAAGRGAVGPVDGRGKAQPTEVGLKGEHVMAVEARVQRALTKGGPEGERTPDDEERGGEHDGAHRD